MVKTIEIFPLVIFDCQVKKSILDEEFIYVLFALEEVVGTTRIQRKSIIEDFLEVFANDILGLSLDRETKFVIEQNY